MYFDSDIINKSETELNTSVLKMKRKTIIHKRLKRTLFDWTKQDKTCEFSRKSSFPSNRQHKNKQLIDLACVN